MIIIIIINLFNLFIFVGKTTPQTFSEQTRALSYLFIVFLSSHANFLFLANSF